MATAGLTALAGRNINFKKKEWLHEKQCDH